MSESKLTFFLFFLLSFSAVEGYGASSEGDGATGTGSTGLPEDIIRKAKCVLPIQRRIDQAEDGDTIFVLPGTYFENIEFKGKAITVLGVGGPEETVIDGRGEGTVVDFAGCPDTTSILSGVTARNGGGSYFIETWRAGGILAFEASCKIDNCIISNNTVGSPEIVCCAGGVEFYQGTVVVRDCVFKNNASGMGGGGCFYKVKGRVTGCRFENNVAFGHICLGDKRSGIGGACYVATLDSLTISNCVFINNRALRISDDYKSEPKGGACFITAEVCLKNNLFINNRSTYGGALYITEPGYVVKSEVTRNIFLDNSAGDEWDSGVGGAIYCWGADGNAQAHIFNNLFSGNGAFEGDSGSVWSGSVFHVGDSGGVVNNIIMNTVSGIAAVFDWASPHHHNCYWNNADGHVDWPGEGTIFMDPKTGPGKKFHIPADSPCFDAGAFTGLEGMVCDDFPDIGAFENCGLNYILPGKLPVSNPEPAYTPDPLSAGKAGGNPDAGAAPAEPSSKPPGYLTNDIK